MRIQILRKVLLTGVEIGLVGACVLATAASAGEQASNGQQSISKSLGLYAFPAKQQTAKQQETDELECFAWARNQSGFDPLTANAANQTAAAKPTAPANDPGAGKIVGGAVAGTAIGAIAGDAGKGAAIGATAGAFRGGAARRDAAAAAQADKQKADAANAQAKANVAQQRADYNKAFGACLEGKGYTVK